MAVVQEGVVVESSYKELLAHLVRITLLSFFMVLPGQSGAPLAETHSGFTPGGGRPFADLPSYGNAFGGVDPCAPQSNATNVGNPSFQTPIAPAPQPAQTLQAVAQPSQTPEVQNNSNGSKDSNPTEEDLAGGDATKGAEVHKARCITCHSGEKYPFADQLLAVLQNDEAKAKGLSPMPQGQSLSSEELKDLVAFLKTK